MLKNSNNFVGGNHMKKKLVALMMAAAVFGTTLLTGCSSKPAEEKAEGGEAAEKEVKIAMVTDVGGVKDQSFNQSAWEGLERAEKELGIKASYLESKQDADYEPNLETLVDQENNLIWGIGFKMADGIAKAAENYPDQQYAIVDFDFEDKTPANVTGVMFKEQEASYLVGLIAGKMTKTNKIGFLGGMDVPVINRFRFGFLAGVKAANPNAEVMVQFANAFDQPAKGKAIANQMFQQGADIIFHAAGDTGNGMIEAAKEQNKMAIGVDRDQNSLAPKNVITSAVKRVDNALFDVAKLIKDGEYKGGKTIKYGLKEGGVDIAPTTKDNVPAEILTFVEEQKAKIISGEIAVPGTEEEFNSMK